MTIVYNSTLVWCRWINEFTPAILLSLPLRRAELEISTEPEISRAHEVEHTIEVQYITVQLFF